MKNLKSVISLLMILLSINIYNAQETASASADDIPSNYKKRSPIYDYAEQNLNSTDTIPDFSKQKNKLKITGTIYESDGVTPAKNVLLFIHQADENGNFELKRHNKKRYVHHRGWVKTNKDGKYTFYTFVPGEYIYGNELKQIHPIIKVPGKEEQEMETLLFDDDPLLKGKCRTQVEETNPNRILKLDKEEGLYVAKRDIILKEDLATF